MKKFCAGVVLAMAASGLGLLHVPTPVSAQGSGDGDAGASRVVDDPQLIGARDDARREHARRTDRLTTVAKVLVEVDTKDTDGVARGLRLLGAEVNGTLPGSVVQALVPVDSLETVAGFGAVNDLKYPRRQGYVPSAPLRRTDVFPQPNVLPGYGGVVGDEVALTRADAWHVAGYTGAGVKVGIVDYFDLLDWTAGENGPDPDASHQFCQDTLSDPFSSSNLCDGPHAIRQSPEIHGNAVAEIVKDMAPNSEAYIASVGTVTDLKAAIDWFAANGVTIMTRSLGSAYDGPGDGTGPLGDAVNYAVSKGIVWFNSAGNEGEDQYMKKVVKATVAIDGGNYVNVNDGNPVVSPAVDTWLRVDSSDRCFFMDGVRWANDWNIPKAQRTDYSIEFWQPKLAFGPGDIFSHKNPTRAQVDPINLNNSGFGPQHGGGLGGNIINVSQRNGSAPLEANDIAVCPARRSNLANGPAGTYVTYIRINRNAATPVGAVADRMEVAIAGSGLFEYQYFDRAGSAAKPVVDSKNPGLVSVGAVDRILDFRLYPKEARSISWYSSQGPTTDGRTKPDVSSWAGINSWTYSTLDPAGGGTFSGTSAASPTAAGVAALLQGAGLANTPITLAALVKHQSRDLGTLGPDNAYGFGLTELASPPSTAAPGSLQGHYEPLPPTRVYDSRQLVGTQQPYPRAPWSIIDVPITRLTPLVPAGASAVAVNITSTGSRTAGFVQAFPWNRTAFGSTSTLNINKAGDIVANFAIVPMGDNGFISLYLPVGGHVVVDVMGYFTKNETSSTNGRFIPVATPVQLADSTLSTGTSASASLPLGPFDAAPASLPTGEVSAVVVDVTASAGTRNWYLRALPNDVNGATVLPSTLNFSSSGAQVTNTAIVPLGADGKIQVYMGAPKSAGGAVLPVSVQVKVDLVGYITSTGAPLSSTGMFVPIAPTRMADTRLPAGSPPITGGTQRAITVGGTTNVFGGAGAPAPASAYSGNWTVTQPAANGHLSVFAGTQPSPDTDNVSYSTGKTVANGALFGAANSTTATVNAFMSATGHVIIDINGYFTP